MENTIILGCFFLVDQIDHDKIYNTTPCAEPNRFIMWHQFWSCRSKWLNMFLSTLHQWWPYWTMPRWRIKWKHFPRYWPFVVPAQRPVTRSFEAFFGLRLNKRLSKQSWGWWFETLSCPLWRHRNANAWNTQMHRMKSSCPKSQEICKCPNFSCGNDSWENTIQPHMTVIEETTKSGTDPKNDMHKALDE